MKTKLVIFGITGDLSTRKLLPALEHIMKRDDELTVIGVSRRDVGVSELLTSAIGHDVIADRFSVFTMDLAQAGDYVDLKSYVDLRADEQAVVYLSVPPSSAADIVDFLGQAGLNGANVKLLFEKPFGFDLESAHDYIDRTSRYYEEGQIYRIDHYAAKEMAQEVFRQRAAGVPWDKDRVSSVSVVAAEAIGVEGRATFYEETGALRDFIQGHLMQLLSLVLMPVPDGSDMDKASEYRLVALQNMKLADPSLTIRAQYQGYQEEVGNIGSLTETFVSMQLASNDVSWQDVPLRLITGKSLNEKRSYIRIEYKDGTETIIEEGSIPMADTSYSDAYERVLVDAIEGRKGIFTTSPELLRAWEIVRPVQESWNMDNSALEIYAPGSSIDEVIKK